MMSNTIAPTSLLVACAMLLACDGGARSSQSTAEASAHVAAGASEAHARGEVGPPPPEQVAYLELDTSFYEKYLSAGGLAIVSSAQVSDYALHEAAYLVDQVLAGRDDLRAALVHGRVRVVVMAPTEFTTDVPEHRDLQPKAHWDMRARGLGPGEEGTVISCGEENLLARAGDPYAGESIFIHEFAHAVHERALLVIEPDFRARLQATYDAARAAGLWEGTYAGSSPIEYWAEAVQSWYGTNAENTHDHNHVNTREELRAYDPGLAALVEAAHGDRAWRYTQPTARLSEGHLRGYDPSAAAPFAWPASVVAAFEAHERGEGLEQVLPLPAGSPRRSSGTSTATTVRFVNSSQVEVVLDWLDESGQAQEYARIAPGASHEQSTHAGNLWRVRDLAGVEIAVYAATATPGLVRIE